MNKYRAAWFGIGLALLTACAGAQGAAARQLAFDIPAQRLSEALNLFGKQAGLSIAFYDDAIADHTTQTVSGSFTPEAALARLLADTALEFEFVNEHTVAIRAGKDKRAAKAQEPDLRLAREEKASAVQAEERSSPAAVKSSPGTEVEEIVVTAQKRAERLQEVPVPVSVVSAQALTNSNQLRLQDYYTKIPGLALSPVGDGGIPSIALRGLTTSGTTNPTVGIVVDEVAYGQTVNPGNSTAPPDIDPGDLARVEVLRGPQGTLYGASSMGGLIKFVTLDPSTERVSGRLQAGTTAVRHGDDLGYSFRGAVNVPLAETLAIRASGFTSREPGYVDNLLTGKEDINRRDSDGARVSALWRPSDDFSVKLNALYQDSDRLGLADTDTALGSGFQQRQLPKTGIYGRSTEAYSATLNGKFDTVDVVSATGYSIDQIDTELDASATLGAGFGLPSPFAVSGVEGPLIRRTEKFTQEIRVSLPLGSKVTGLMGAFYTREKAAVKLVYYAVDPATLQRVGVLYTNDLPSTFEDRALFANLTFDITDRFDIQVGGRYAENEFGFSQVQTGYVSTRINGTSPSIRGEVGAKDNAFTYLLTPRFRISPDLMAYARMASGYRPGGVNPVCNASVVPCTYDADTTQNYELGFKGNVLGGILSYDASLYYIVWNDIQINLTDRASTLTYTDNVSAAKSQGVELSLESTPTDGLTLSTTMAYTDAELTRDFPATATNGFGRRGDRLPYGSRFSGSFSVDREFPLGSAATGFVGGSLSYIGDRKGVFRAATQVRETFAAYTQVDFRAGATYGSWTLNAFVNNAGDKRGILRTGLDSLRPTFVTYIQPRTVGMNLSKTF